MGTVVVLGMTSSACGYPHVMLNAPAESAPIEERGRAYEQLKPLSMHETHTTYYQGGAMVGASRTTDYLQLADGRRVYHAEDILNVVPADSPSARAARESDSRASTASTYTTISWILITVGGVIMIAPLLDSDTNFDTTPFLIGGGVMLAGLPFIFMASSQRAQANDEKATAFETYEPALRKKMNLCATKDRQIIDCAAPPPAPGPVAEPASAPTPAPAPAPATAPAPETTPTTP